MRGGCWNGKKCLFRARLRLAFPRSGYIRHESTVPKCRWEMMTLHRPFFPFQLFLPASKLMVLLQYSNNRCYNKFFGGRIW